MKMNNEAMSDIKPCSWCGGDEFDFFYEDKRIACQNRDCNFYCLAFPRDDWNRESPIQRKNQILREALENLSGVFKYYEDAYSKAEWSFCCNGRECACMGKPCDPEYYIYQDLMRAREALKQIEEMK